MADNKLAKTEDPKTALATTTSHFLAERPARPESREGLEDLTKDDLRIPRLALAQALSPQVTNGDPNRIEGLQVGDLFNSVTKQVYGSSVDVQIIRKAKLRAMEFNSIDDGGGVKDPNVPLDDDRLKWGTSGNKKEDKPKATLFRDYIARLLPSRELIGLSFKSSGIKVAKDLNNLIAFRKGAIWEGVYNISTGMQLTPKPHQVFKVENRGWATTEDCESARPIYLALKDLDLADAMDRDHVDPEDAEYVQSGAAGAHEEM